VAWPHIDKVCCSWSCSLGQLDRSSQHFSGTKVLMVALGDSGVQFVYRQRPTSRQLIRWSETTDTVATTTWPPEKQLTVFRDATTTRILSAGGLRVFLKVCRLLCMRKKVYFAETLHLVMHEKVGTLAPHVRVACGCSGTGRTRALGQFREASALTASFPHQVR
jgi:hypothetical protein